MPIKDYIRRGIEYVYTGVPVKKLDATISYLKPSNKLLGKKIVVTGGGRGLGLAMAKRFVAEGANVLIAGRNEMCLKESALEMGCSFLRLDVQDVHSFTSFIDEAWELLGGINCLVNNAGVSHHEGNIRNVTIDDFNIQINTNLRSGYFLSQKFIDKYEKADVKSGNILFVSSERGVMADDLPYGITKAAINTLVQGLACELIDRGIRVNAMAPGVTASDMTGFNRDGSMTLHSQATGRVYLPEEMAEIACFLLSDASNLLNGQIIVCNEGKSINFRR